MCDLTNVCVTIHYFLTAAMGTPTIHAKVFYNMYRIFLNGRLVDILFYFDTNNCSATPMCY